MTKKLPEDQKKIGFWLNVEKQDGDGCWLWTGHIQVNGYGLASYRGKTTMAHRASWMMENGPIPKGMLVCHHCDTRACVRPDHLFLGTHSDNMRDMYRKGRGPTGKRNGSHTKPKRRAYGNRNGSRTHPERRPRGDDHWTRKRPERLHGEGNPNCKVGDDDVKEIRRLYANGGISQEQIGEMFGISQVHVSRLVRKKLRQ